MKLVAFISFALLLAAFGEVTFPGRLWSAEIMNEQVVTMSYQDLRELSRRLSGIQRIVCSIEQGRNCQNVSNACGNACANLLGGALTDCMNVCSCNYYHCRTACGDDASMPPSCRQ
jgi:hypothetical protein